MENNMMGTMDDKMREIERRIAEGRTPFDWACREVARDRLRRLQAGSRLVEVKPLKLPKFRPWGPEE
jgi:hypothetical protein